MEVIGLDYPDHIATAVKFRGNISGDAILVEGVKYIICDPTFIGANIGQCMPGYRGIEPDIIEF